MYDYYEKNYNTMINSNKLIKIIIDFFNHHNNNNANHFS